ncbi:hypothetical protein [Amniculibacterium aquaticum]|uniref:hypothetical protein n=1 Tax=Amniculibacterium aquaticum TaxID=2479858 RepID=UPI000F5B636B|nr:hypothetical protein [Amniculibacterium aquaticum]
MKKLLLTAALVVTGFASAKQSIHKIENIEKDTKISSNYFYGFCTVTIVRYNTDGTYTIIRSFTRMTETKEQCEALTALSVSMEQWGIDSSNLN